MFRRLIAEDRIERAPVAEVFRLHAREVFLSAFARMAEQAPFYIFTAFVFAYGVGTLKVSRDLLLAAVLVASLVSFVSIPLAGHMSDRFGRKRVYIIGAVLTGLFGWVYFALLDTLMPFWIFIAIILSLIPHDIMYGPQAALIAESFTGRVRYSGASIGYQLASIIAGGPAPLIAAALFAKYQSWVAISVYITICAVISVVSAAMLKDYTGKDISAEYAFGRGVSVVDLTPPPNPLPPTPSRKGRENDRYVDSGVMPRAAVGRCSPTVAGSVALPPAAPARARSTRPRVRQRRRR